MSHRYGERQPLRSQEYPKSSPQTEAGAFSEDQVEGAHATPVKSDIVAEKTTDVITDAESSYKGPLGSVTRVPSLDDINSWTLAQLRTQLEELFIEKRKATGQARGDLEARRLSLIELITRIERAEEKRRDAARRGEV